VTSANAPGGVPLKYLKKEVGRQSEKVEMRMGDVAIAATGPSLNAEVVLLRAGN